MAHKILVVDDDKAMSELVKDALVFKGFKVSVASTAEAALRLVRSEAPDLLVLDVNLPGFSGVQLCEQLRKEPSTSALLILMLTSLNKEDQKIRGLESGADDYMTKPFSGRELAARVEALLRRQGLRQASSNVLEGGGITMDLGRHEATVKGKKLDLRPKEYALLELLIKRKGQVLSHSVIAETVWGDQRLVTSANIKWWIHQLREKLGPAGSKIEAVPQLGYKFSDE